MRYLDNWLRGEIVCGSDSLIRSEARYLQKGPQDLKVTLSYPMPRLANRGGAKLSWHSCLVANLVANRGTRGDRREAIGFYVSNLLT